MQQVLTNNFYPGGSKEQIDHWIGGARSRGYRRCCCDDDCWIPYLDSPWANTLGNTKEQVVVNNNENLHQSDLSKEPRLMKATFFREPRQRKFSLSNYLLMVTQHLSHLSRRWQQQTNPMNVPWGIPKDLPSHRRLIISFSAKTSLTHSFICSLPSLSKNESQRSANDVAER